MKEITANIINSLLLGAAVLLGAISDGEITIKSIIIAIGAAGLVIVNSFREYLVKAELTPKQIKLKADCDKAKKKLFNFLNI